MTTQTNHPLFVGINFEEWLGDTMLLIQQIDSPLFKDVYTYKEQFLLKKIVHGHLQANESVYQCMIACQFNKARIISSIIESRVEDPENHITFSTQTGTNTITYHLINLTKGGSDLDTIAAQTMD